MLRQKLRTKDLHKNVVFGQKTGEFTIQHQLHSHQQPIFPMIKAMTSSADKITENFTGKEKDDEIELNYFGTRYLDPMLGMWISVDPARQFTSPYLYAGNGYNPVNGVDEDGNEFDLDEAGQNELDNALCMDDPEIQKRIAKIDAAPETYRSSPLKEGMTGPNFDSRERVFYYDPNSEMSMQDQFIHEMLGHGYQTHQGILPARPIPISAEVDAYGLQYRAPTKLNRSNDKIYNIWKNNKDNDRGFGIWLMRHPATKETYNSKKI